MQYLQIKYLNLMIKQIKNLFFWYFLFFSGRCFAADSATNYNIISNQPLPDATGAVLRLFGAFVFVIGLFLIGAYLFKNWRGVIAKDFRKNNLKIVEVKHIGSRQALFVVGYKEKRMLVGVSQSNINLISHLPDEEQPVQEDKVPPFVSIMNKLSGSK